MIMTTNNYAIYYLLVFINASSCRMFHPKKRWEDDVP